MGETHHNKEIYITIHLILLLTICCSKLDQDTEPDKNLKPDEIESLKIQTSEIPDGFVLYQERLSKPGESSNEQIYQFWRRDSIEQDLVLIEETKETFDNPTGASSSQIWYRGDKKGEQDKIEINIVICLSDSMMENTITYFTKEAYASIFICTETPVIGEKTWIPEYPSQFSYSMMFLKINVFIRLYVRLKHKNPEEIKKMTEYLAKTIESKIIF